MTQIHKFAMNLLSICSFAMPFVQLDPIFVIIIYLKPKSLDWDSKTSFRIYSYGGTGESA